MDSTSKRDSNETTVKINEEQDWTNKQLKAWKELPGYRRVEYESTNQDEPDPDWTDEQLKRWNELPRLPPRLSPRKRRKDVELTPENCWEECERLHSLEMLQDEAIDSTRKMYIEPDISQKDKFETVFKILKTVEMVKSECIGDSTKPCWCEPCIRLYWSKKDSK